MISFLEGLKKTHTDDASIRAFNEIENQLREKKYGLVWEEHSEEVDELLKENIPVLSADKKRRLCKDGNLPWNFIIEGDNLQALYLLEKTHKGKVDCIYIDPPYNTGATNWKYNNDYVDGNDVYRHSKWLSMMKERISLAKKLLSPAGFFVCAIDANELYAIGALLDEIFRENNRLGVVTVLHNPKGRNFTKWFSANSEYMLVYANDNAQASFNEVALDEDIKKTFNLQDDNTGKRYRLEPFMRSRTETLRENKPNFWYPLYVSKDLKEITREKKSSYREIYPISSTGKEATWINLPETFDEKNKDGWFVAKEEEGNVVIYRKLYEQQVYKNVWVEKKYQSEFNGTNLLKEIFKEKVFDYPKSLYLVEDILKLTSKRDSVILDFFAGSGTTMHAVNLLNAEDGGNRTCIMVTNNEISDAEAKGFREKGIKKGDKEWEEKGIAKYVTWPRTVCSINGVDVNGDPLKGNYIGSDKPMANGFKANVKYFKCEWTQRKPENYLLSNALSLHIKEMIELQNALEIDQRKNVLILNKTDFKDIVLDEKKYKKIERMWVNQNIVFNAKELKLLKAKGYKDIPKEFFGQELREVAE